MYDTPETVSEYSWRNNSPPNLQTQNIIDDAKIAEVFNNPLNINQQNWADVMDQDKVSSKSKSPIKDGDITNAFEKLKGKVSK